MDITHLHAIFSQIVQRTQHKVRGALHVVQEIDRPSCAPTLSETFRGQCGLAQCIAGYALKDLGMQVHPIATQSLDAYWHGHAALSVEVESEDRTRWFIIDPTFIQFCQDVAPAEVPNPSFYLNTDEEGRSILNLLTERGFFELTPGRASSYLAAFCQGKRPFQTDDDAFAFLKRPPFHPYHFCYSPGSDRYSRETLQRDGLLIRAQSLGIG